MANTQNSIPRILISFPLGHGHTYVCGCDHQIREDGQGGSHNVIRICRLHDVAPQLLEALSRLLGASGHYHAPDEQLATDFNCPTEWITLARAAIEAANGS